MLDSLLYLPNQCRVSKILTVDLHESTKKKQQLFNKIITYDETLAINVLSDFGSYEMFPEISLYLNQHCFRNGGEHEFKTVQFIESLYNTFTKEDDLLQKSSIIRMIAELLVLQKLEEKYSD